MKTRVSFVMTVFNGAPHIEESLTALSKMDWPDFEVIVADDGSTDNTPEIVTALAERDSRIMFTPLGRVGRASALNKAVALASGNYIAINDVDDVSLPNRLSVTVAPLLSDASLAFVAGGHKTIADEDWEKPGSMPARSTSLNRARPVSSRELYRRNLFVHSSITFPKEKWAASGGYNETLKSFIDYDFYFRLLAQGKGLIDGEVVVLHRRHMNTVFKRQSVWQYLTNYRAAMRTARRLCPVPLADRIYDLKPYAMTAHLAWRRNRATRS
jgi:glycosyltransferase involved in cell wall biosynthesis